MKTTFLPSLLLIALIGILTGLVAGFVGYSAGRDIGTAISYDASFAVGYRDAFDRNRDDGFQQGYSEGLDQGIQQGITQVNDNQIEAARNEGFSRGRDTGYSEGYTLGVEAGTLEGIKTGIDGFLTSKRLEVRRELERDNHICNSTNICERTISNDTSTGRRVWSVFNLNSMTHTINVDYTLDGTQYKQRVIIDYKAGTLSGEWRLRTSAYISPILLYNFQSSKMIVNSTNESDQEQSDFLMTWYTGTANAKTIGDNAGITWVLSANRG
jgi:hypothetical protein